MQGGKAQLCRNLWGHAAKLGVDQVKESFAVPRE